MCYCQQLAVPCYPESVVDDINKQISVLKSEYHAFVNKLRSLEPGRAIADHKYRSHLKRASDGKYFVTAFAYFNFYCLFLLIFQLVNIMELCSSVQFSSNDSYSYIKQVCMNYHFCCRNDGITGEIVSSDSTT